MKNNIEQSEKIAESIVDIMQQSKARNEDEFKEWYKTNRHAPRIVADLTDGVVLEKEVANFHHEEKFLLANDLVNKMKKRERRRWIVRMTSVAAVLTIISLILYFTSEKSIENSKIVAEQQIKKEQSLSEKPIIITQGGMEIDLLDTSSKNIINHKNNLEIHNVSAIVKEKLSHEASSFNLNKIIVPKRYTTKVTLDDGSIVHLNANSELQFPTKFVGNSRRVELNGEAFFEVATSDKQFIVSINGSEVKVYGTKFNIKSRSKNTLEALLVSGSVGVTGNGMPEVIMKPNQRLEMDYETKQYQSENVDCHDFLGWVKGLFFFNNTPMHQVVKELETWYGVEINYSSPEIDNLKMNFSIDHDNEFEDIILFMEKITDVKFIKERSNVYRLEK